MNIFRLIILFVLPALFSTGQIFAATYTVTVNAGTGAGSLKAAIDLANANAGADIIVFALGLDPIIETGVLANITDPVTIDGTSWSGANGGQKIQLQLSKGPGAGNYTTNLRFIAGSANSAILNVAVSGGQVYMENTNNVSVTNNYFQLSSDGLAAGAGNINPANSINMLNSNTITISNNVFGNRTGISYHIFTNNGDNVTIQNNTFGFWANGTNHTSVIGGGVFLTNGSDGGNISNNVFGNLSGTVVNIDNSHNATVNNNIVGFAANGTTNAPIAGSSHGIFINISNGTSISNNLVGNIPRNGLSASSSTNVSVTANWVGINNNGACAPAVWAGLSMTAVTSSSITNNIFRCNNNLNVYFHSSSNITLTGNTIANAGSATSSGIYFEQGNSIFTISNNVITGNGTGGGLRLESNASVNTRITITQNSIYCNGNATNDGIVLGAGSNENIAAPAITAYGANTTSGTGNAGNTIHLYRNVTNTGTPCQDCEGEIYIGTTTVGGGGTWSITHNLNLGGATATAVTATQTNSNGSTSRFGGCSTPPPLPVELLTFSATVTAQGALLKWSTASEENNKGFYIEKSDNAEDFSIIGFVEGNHTTRRLSEYSYTDTDVMQGIQYYRLKQTDLDGSFAYSPIIKIIPDEIISAELYPNPASEGNTNLVIVSPVPEEAVIELYNAQGSFTSSSKINIESGRNEFPVVVPVRGYYFVKVILAEKIIVRPLVVN